MLRALRLQLPPAAVNSKCSGGAGLTHYKDGRVIFPLRNRRFTLCVSLQQQSPPSDSSNLTTSTVGYSSTPIHLSSWTLSHRHIHILNFIACAAAISATWLFCSAIPALLAFRRAAESMEKLMDVAREELPDTMAAVRLSGMELTDLTSELSEMGQELTKGVKKSTRAVRKAEENLRQFTNMTSSAPMQEVAPTVNKASGPVPARTSRSMREGIVKARSFVQMLLSVALFLRFLYNYLKPRTNKS